MTKYTNPKKTARLKIAVCFFGHLRTYKKCAPFLRRNLLDNYDCDLFMHTWTTLDHETKSWHDYPKTKGLAAETDIINAYGEFKGLAIEEQKPVDMGTIKTKPSHNCPPFDVSIFGIGAIFHSIRKSIRLCEEYADPKGVKYDLVLCIRPDIWLKKPLNIEEILESLSEQDIARGFFTITNYFTKLVRGFESLSANDVLFFGKPEVISAIFKNTTSYTDRFKPNTLIHQGQELELIKLVQERGFVPYRVDFRHEIDWEIRRLDTKRRRFLRVRIRKNYIHINLFQACMRQLCRLRFAILGWEFDCCVGTKNTA